VLLFSQLPRGQENIMLRWTAFAHPTRGAARRHRGEQPSAFAAASTSAVLIRPASAADAPQIARLSELDERVLPLGERLIGELSGRVVAAVDVVSGATVADPFIPTVGVVELLGLRAAQVRR